MIEFLFANPSALALEWYRWGVAIALALSIVTTMWIFFDSQRQALNAIFWRVLSLVAALVVIPSAVLSLQPELGERLGQLPILLAYLGLLAAAVSLVSLFLYAFGIGVGDVVEEPDSLAYEPLPPISRTPPDGQRPAGERTTPLSASLPAVPPTQVLAPESQGAGNGEATLVLSGQTRPQDEPLAWLVRMTGAQAGRSHRLQPLTHLGREAQYNDLIIEDVAVSRQHARIRLEREGFVLYDLASANGIYVNEEQVQRQTLNNGDRIRLGTTVLGFMRVAERTPDRTDDAGEGDEETQALAPSAQKA